MTEEQAARLLELTGEISYLLLCLWGLGFFFIGWQFCGVLLGRWVSSWGRSRGH